MRAQAVAVCVHISQGLVARPVNNVMLIRRAAQFGELAMQMQHFAAAGTLVQIVDILGDDAHMVVIGQPRQCQMGGIGRHRLQLAAAGIVKIQHHLRIARKRLRGGHFFHFMPFPQAIAVAKSLQAAVGADAGASEHHNIVFRHIHSLFQTGDAPRHILCAIFKK